MNDYADRFVADVERERLARQEDRREAEAFQGKIDREIAYEQNVSGLEIAWRKRIESFAREAVHHIQPDGDYSERDTWQLEASDVVASRLFDSERWANVKATDISDIAWEAVQRVIDSE